MAITDGDGGPKKGSAGGFSYYQRNGQTIMRMKKNMTHDVPPTPARARQMSKFPNLITAWRYLKYALRGCFENKKPGATDYSVFMALNLKRTQVHLTKEESDGQACVVDHFVISDGSLGPSIQVAESGEWMVSDLLVAPSRMRPDPTVGDFGAALTGSNNGRLQAGDEILFVRMMQVRSLANNMLKAETHVRRLTLSTRSTLPLQQVLAEQGPLDGFDVVDGHLAARREVGDLVAWIHRRQGRDGHWKVTSQSLVGTNPALDKYIDTKAIIAASRSYTTAVEPFMMPQSKPKPMAVIDALSNDLLLGSTEGSGTYPVGSQATLRAIPREGCRFLCWDDGWEEPERQVKVERAATFKAIFAPRR